MPTWIMLVTPKVAFIKSIFVFPIKIADYLLMTVTVAV